jgi:hypothetical protein
VKLILGIVIGAILFIPATALASEWMWEGTKRPKPIYSLHNSGSSIGFVQVFDDQDNKCYVASLDNKEIAGDSVSISCVKR